MKNKIYYKVVLKEDSKYYSAVTEGKARVEYVTGERIKAPEWLQEKGYYITVFELLEYAIAFYKGNHNDDMVILACRAFGIIQKLPAFQSFCALARGELDLAGWGWPTGTLMAKGGIEILEEVR